MVDLVVDLLIKKLNEQCPGTQGSQWWAEEDGCEYIILWAKGRTTIKLYPRPFAKTNDEGNLVVGVKWFINPEENTTEEMQTEEFKLTNSFFKM